MTNTHALEMVLKTDLKSLRLPTMLREYPSCNREALEKNNSYIEFLATLTALEVKERGIKRINRRISEAHFPVLKTVDTFDMEKAPGLNRHLLMDLTDVHYVANCENIIFVGKSGTGKTHLATGLGIEACRQNYRVRFYTACKLVTELVEARDEYRLKQFMERLKRFDILVLDELGYVPFVKAGAELLFQVLADRHEFRSTIITTNLPFQKWVDVFGDAVLTAALLDRITHHCSIFECNWQSFRFQESSLKRKKQTGDKKLS